MDDTFKYSAAGVSFGNFALQAGNTDPRDIAANADGSRLWVLDKDKNVNVYTSDGTAQGLWKADGLGKEPEGLTLDGSDLWMGDRDRKIHWYDNAAGNTSGTDKADKNFGLSISGNLKGIVTDGTSLWVVTEGGTDYVYRFAIARDGGGNPTGLTKNGEWKLATANSKPTGITLDPTGASPSLWIVDESSDSVYEYGNGRSLTAGTGIVTTSFKLAPGNVAPQGIADPKVADPAIRPASADRGEQGPKDTGGFSPMLPVTPCAAPLPLSGAAPAASSPSRAPRFSAPPAAATGVVLGTAGTQARTRDLIFRRWARIAAQNSAAICGGRNWIRSIFHLNLSPNLRSERHEVRERLGERLGERLRGRRTKNPAAPRVCRQATFTRGHLHCPVVERLLPCVTS